MWVPEWHHTDHGLHVHFAVGRFVPQSKIRQTWGRGYVGIKLLGDLPVGSGTVDEARVARSDHAYNLRPTIDRPLDPAEIPVQVEYRRAWWRS